MSAPTRTPLPTEARCEGCCMFTDQISELAHLHARDTTMAIVSLSDYTPLGRQEAWEDTPPGRPQTPPYQWWRLHDEY